MTTYGMGIEHPDAGSGDRWFGRRIAAFFGRAAVAWRYRNAVRRTERQLDGFSDQMLADIGLTRGGIPAAVAGRINENKIPYWSR